MERGRRLVNSFLTFPPGGPSDAFTCILVRHMATTGGKTLPDPGPPSPAPPGPLPSPIGPPAPYEYEAYEWEEGDDIKLAFAAHEEVIVLGCVRLHQENPTAVPLLHHDEVQLRIRSNLC
jgi:hypothetical protein